MRTVPELLTRLEGESADTPAILALERPPLSRARLAGEVSAQAAWLARHGVERGTRVAVVMPAGAEMAVLALAISSVATCVPLNPASTRPELERLLATLGCSMLIQGLGPDSPAAAAAHAAGIQVVECTAKTDQPAGSFLLTMAEGPVTDREGPSAPAGSGGAISPAAPASGSDVAFVLLTSGSTASPKAVPLTHANVVASAGNVARSLELAAEDRCLATLPLFHIGGIVDLLLAPLFAGGSVIAASDMSSSTVLACVDALRPTWYQGVPTMLLDLVDRVEREQLRPDLSGLRFVRSVSAPLSAVDRERFEARLGVAVVEMYGMTETAGLIASDGLPPASHKAGSVGRVCGPEVMIADDSGAPLESPLVGEVLVRGPTVTSGYELTDEDSGQWFHGDWFRTGDQGYLDPDGYLYLTGRIKDIINRGGEKISPRELDELATRHPRIRDAACFPAPHPTLGEEVAIAVVGDGQLSAAEVASWFEGQVSAFKVPRVVRFVDALPRTPGGKLQRGKLQSLVSESDTTSVKREIAEPESELARELVTLWEKVLGVSPIGIDDDFFDLGGDSLKAATMIQGLFDPIPEDLEIGSVFDAPTIRALEPMVARARARQSAPAEAPAVLQDEGLAPAQLQELRARLTGWRGKRRSPGALVVGVNTDGWKRPIFWCSNDARDYDRLSRAMGADQPLYAMRSLHRLDWKSQASIERVALLYLRELKELQPAGPYLIGGFCDGGKVAFEIGDQLRRGGDEVELLMLLDMFVPKPYGGRVSMFVAGDEPGGRYERFPRFVRPERGWKKFYTGQMSIRVAPWQHRAFFAPENVPDVAEHLRREFDLAQAGRPSPFDAEPEPPEAQPHQILPANGYRCGVRGFVPMHMYPGEEASINLTVTNESEVSWEPTSGSGIQVQSRWQNMADFDARIPLDGWAPLQESVAPGASTRVTLKIRAPQRADRWHLIVDVVEDGVTPFPDRGASFGRRAVFIDPSARWFRFIRRPLRRTVF